MYRSPGDPYLLPPFRMLLAINQFQFNSIEENYNKDILQHEGVCNIPVADVNIYQSVPLPIGNPGRH